MTLVKCTQHENRYLSKYVKTYKVSDLFEKFSGQARIGGLTTYAGVTTGSGVIARYDDDISLIGNMLHIYMQVLIDQLGLLKFVVHIKRRHFSGNIESLIYIILQIVLKNMIGYIDLYSIILQN